MTVLDQARVFAGMVLCGAGMGLLNDLLGLLRKNVIFTAAADLLLGISCALGVISMGLVMRCDPSGIYTVLGVAVGWMIYAASLGMGVRALARFLLKM